MAQANGTANYDGGLIRCSGCVHFRYFENEKGHNTSHALGKCEGEPWDGNSGQWAMFQHHCRNFVRKEKEGSDSGG